MHGRQQDWRIHREDNARDWLICCCTRAAANWRAVLVGARGRMVVAGRKGGSGGSWRGDATVTQLATLYPVAVIVYRLSQRRSGKSRSRPRREDQFRNHRSKGTVPLFEPEPEGSASEPMAATPEIQLRQEESRGGIGRAMLGLSTACACHARCCRGAGVMRLREGTSCSMFSPSRSL